MPVSIKYQVAYLLRRHALVTGRFELYRKFQEILAPDFPTKLCIISLSKNLNLKQVLRLARKNKISLEEAQIKTRLQLDFA